MYNLSSIVNLIHNITSKIYRYCLLLGTILVLIIFTSNAQDACRSTLIPRLTIGGQGIVLLGAADNVRSEPSTQGALIGRIAGGASFIVLEGAICSGDFIWWRVESGAIQGWTVEANTSDYFVRPINGRIVLFENVLFDLPLELATDVASTHYIPDPLEPTRGVEHLEFVLNEYPDDNHGEHSLPQLNVYRADAYNENTTMLGDAGRYIIEILPVVLQEQPDLYTTYAERRDLPDEAPNVAQAFLAQMQYLNFENGRGYRFITQYAQDMVELNNANLLYRYVGMTNDGAYFVSATFPIEAPRLREAIGDDIYTYSGEEYAAYTLGTQQFLDAIPLADYTPDLTQLDALMQSLYVGEG
jgi:uncharacterized protein YraI